MQSSRQLFNNENYFEMKRKYFPPLCEMTEFRFTTSILAGSTPQTTSVTRSHKNVTTPEENAKGWGNLW